MTDAIGGRARWLVRQLHHLAASDAELFVTPSDTTVGRLSGEDGVYLATARGWRFEGPSYHKARGALARELMRRRWLMP